MAEKKLSVVITGDAKGARKAMGEVGSSAGGMQAKLNSVAGGVGKAFKAAAVGAGALAVGAGAFVKGGVDALIEMERLGAQTESVIKATGGAAGVSSEQVLAYADSLEKATGIEAESIIEGQNMLLTFKDIKNGVGEGNDIFNQATDIMTDMSVAMGTDASKTAVQLGKALNDPIKGISALSKVGVTFTEQQKAQIKAMVEAGDVAGAQKVILAELNSEFGGSAEAFGDTTAGKVAKLKNLFGDFQEALASKLLPVIEKVTDWLAKKIPQASDVIQAKLVELGPTFDKVAGYARSFADAFASLAEKARPALEAVEGFIRSNPGPFFAALGVVVAAAFGVWAVSAGAAAAATLAALAPVIAVAAVVAVLAGALVYAYQNFDGFREAVDKAAVFVRDVAMPAISDAIKVVWENITYTIGLIKSAWDAWGDELLSIASTAWGLIKGSVDNAIKQVKGIIDVVMGIIHGDWGRAWDGLKAILSAAFDQMKLVADTALKLLGAVISAAWDAIKLVASEAWDGFKRIVSGAIDGAVDFARKLPGRIVDAIGNLADKLYQAGKDLIAGLVRGITDSIPSISDVLGTVTDMIPDWKGPASRDAKLLAPNGKLIMGGLVDGFDAALPEVRAKLERITVDLPSAAPASLSAAPRMTVPSGRGGGDTYNIDMSGSTFEDGTDAGERAVEAIIRFGQAQNRPVIPTGLVG